MIAALIVMYLWAGATAVVLDFIGDVAPARPPGFAWSLFLLWPLFLAFVAFEVAKMAAASQRRHP